MKKKHQEIFDAYLKVHHPNIDDSTKETLTNAFVVGFNQGSNHRYTKFEFEFKPLILLKRVLGLPFFLGFLIIHQIYNLLKISRLFVLYGGESIVYSRSITAKTITDVYDRVEAYFNEKNTSDDDEKLFSAFNLKFKEFLQFASPKKSLDLFEFMKSRDKGFLIKMLDVIRDNSVFKKETDGDGKVIYDNAIVYGEMYDCLVKFIQRKLLDSKDIKHPDFEYFTLKYMKKYDKEVTIHDIIVFLLEQSINDFPVLKKD